MSVVTSSLVGPTVTASPFRCRRLVPGSSVGSDESYCDVVRLVVVIGTGWMSCAVVESGCCGDLYPSSGSGVLSVSAASAGGVSVTVVSVGAADEDSCCVGGSVRVSPVSLSVSWVSAVCMSCSVVVPDLGEVVVELSVSVDDVAAETLADLCECDCESTVCRVVY